MKRITLIFAFLAFLLGVRAQQKTERSRFGKLLHRAQHVARPVSKSWFTGGLPLAGQGDADGKYYNKY